MNLLINLNIIEIINANVGEILPKSSTHLSGHIVLLNTLKSNIIEINKTPILIPKYMDSRVNAFPFGKYLIIVIPS
jgi:hypothetical protein